jgi:hypothetical protein
METPAASAAAAESAASPEGFVSGYDMPDTPVGARPARATPAGGSARMAQPASPGPDAPEVEVPIGRDPDPVGPLSAETLDRLADLVVRRMSERVVREIAWEVIPGVAETIVRERIKELEEPER